MLRHLLNDRNALLVAADRLDDGEDGTTTSVSRALRSLAEWTEADVQREAASVKRSEYFRSVRAIADEIETAVKDGEILDDAELGERLHEDVDGSQWVIYTPRAQQVLAESDNDAAGVDSLGVDGFDWSDGVPWSSLAFFAMQADVRDLLDDVESIRREHAHDVAASIPRERCEDLLRSVDLFDDDDEPTEDLRDAVAENVLDGTLDWSVLDAAAAV